MIYKSVLDTSIFEFAGCLFCIGRRVDNGWVFGFGFAAGALSVCT